MTECRPHIENEQLTKKDALYKSTSLLYFKDSLAMSVSVSVCVTQATTLYCLVTEYAKGGELLSYIKSQKDGRLTEAVARPFVRQLVSALHYVHERGIVHRSQRRLASSLAVITTLSNTY